MCSLLAIADSSEASERTFIQTQQIVEARRQQFPSDSLVYMMFFKEILNILINLSVMLFLG